MMKNSNAELLSGAAVAASLLQFLGPLLSAVTVPAVGLLACHKLDFLALANDAKF